MTDSIYLNELMGFSHIRTRRNQALGLGGTCFWCGFSRIDLSKFSDPYVLMGGFGNYGHDHLWIPPSFLFGTQSGFTTSLLWLSLASRDILEQKNFPRQGVRKEGALREHPLGSQRLPSRVL